MKTIPSFLVVLTMLFPILSLDSHAEEGMWLFNDPPREDIRERYGFELTDAWLDHLRLASIRFNNGGSGSFVSQDGLILSNHHVGADAIQKLSTPERDLLRDGFVARTLAEELPCVDLELNVLLNIEDVTGRVNDAIPANAGPEEAARARRAIVAEIERESLEATGLRSDVITLYQGGRYHLYQFKRYTDIRLVFAPELQAAFFGGDPDNFEYPRYNLDAALFRAYENDQPVQVSNYLAWSKAGPADGELTFVSGHPGRTSRLLTMSELAYLRDVQFPYTLERLNRLEVLLHAWSQRSEENARRAKDDLFGVQNSRKARNGGMAGLLDPALMGHKADAERAFRRALESNPEWKPAEAAYELIDAAQRELERIALRYRMLEARHGFQGTLFDIARTLLRAGDERSQPDGQRLPEYSDASRASLELDLFSSKPVYADLEQLLLADSLTFLTTKLGIQDPLVQAVLAGQAPAVRAAELIAGTRVHEVKFRRALYDGGAQGVAAAKDPMIELARLVDAEARSLRERLEAQDEIKQQAHAAIARARFALQGTSVYPDATFTLRLSYGTVQGYREGNQSLPAMTRMAGLFERADAMDHRPPFDLPELWLERRQALDLETYINFVGTHDIIGGNSGSPVVNRAGELVGLIFDGNTHSLVLDFVYEDEKARSISVHSAAILEALRNVYRAEHLVHELTTGQLPKRTDQTVGDEQSPKNRR
jgi:hypothetical protein